MTKLLAGCDTREKLLPEMLDQAKENLDNMKCFGIQEEFDASCLLLAKRLGWSVPFYQRTNVSSVSKAEAQDMGEITAEIIEKIEQAQLLDKELYAYARRKFDQACIEEGIGQDVVSSFQVMNKWFSSGNR